MLTDLHRQFANLAIDALGGTLAVAKMFGTTEQVVCNWRTRGLPPDTFDAMRPLVLKKVGSAPPLMWRQRMLQHKKVPRPVRKNGRK
jgi:hypothetical protein